MGILRRIRRVRDLLRRRPFITVSLHGWLTARPQVTLGVQSRNGLMSLIGRDDSPQGNAQVESYARTLSHITGLPILDERRTQDAERAQERGRTYIGSEEALCKVRRRRLRLTCIPF